MKNTFDKELKQKLANASLEETGIAFDKEKLWNRIEQKKSSGRSIVLPWISHIAAVAAGLLIGLFIFLKEEPQDQINVTQTRTIPAKVTLRDTVYVFQNTPAKIAPIKKITVQQQPGITQHLPAPEQEPKEPFITPVILKQEETLVATAATIPAKPRVLHLSDIDNENAHPKVARKQDLAFLKKYRNPGQAGQNQETFSMIIGKEIFNAKN